MSHEFKPGSFNKIVQGPEKSVEDEATILKKEFDKNNGLVNDVLLPAAERAREHSEHLPAGGRIVNFASVPKPESDGTYTHQRFEVVPPDADSQDDSYVITDATIEYDKEGNGVESSVEYVINAADMQLNSYIVDRLIERNLRIHERQRIENPASQLADNKDEEREDIKRIIGKLKLHQ